MRDLQALNRESVVELTVTGRKSGKPHTVKIWFAADREKVYVTSGRGLGAQWIKNLQKNPQVTLRIGTATLKGTASWREGPEVRATIFPLFFRKYFSARIFSWVLGWYKQEFAFEITPEED
ncbi:MAG: nitroreductase family deazaflavin-dependent oxidoreductase [Deltaproteobacteria bacterium]|nr:nitroreductase family deazaflavin-dependent oxidoreductase [Deltaproteobacteria bacterium]